MTKPTLPPKTPTTPRPRLSHDEHQAEHQAEQLARVESWRRYAVPVVVREIPNDV
jgi:hypothetical protein